MKKLMVAVIASVAIFLAWFAYYSATKLEVKPYALTGEVIAVHAGLQTVTIHNANISGFMDPMDMDYEVKDPEFLASLKPGNIIHATLWSDGHNVWRLENMSVAQRK